MFFLLNFIAIYIFLPLWIANQSRKALLKANADQSTLVAIALIYCVFAAIVPTIYIYYIGSRESQWKALTANDWPLLLFATLFFRAYDIAYFQLLNIFRSAWKGDLDVHKFPDRPFFRKR
jgi:hypothetical protein